MYGIPYVFISKETAKEITEGLNQWSGEPAFAARVSLRFARPALGDGVPAVPVPGGIEGRQL